jgi:hypothetical protein
MDGMPGTPKAVVKKPTTAFLLTLAGGSATILYSSSLFPYTQSFYIASTFFQNSFILGIIIVFTGAILHERPQQRLTWSSMIIALSLIDIVLFDTLSSTIPQSQFGAIGAITSLIGGLLGLAPTGREGSKQTHQT